MTNDSSTYRKPSSKKKINPSKNRKTVVVLRKKSTAKTKRKPKFEKARIIAKPKPKKPKAPPPPKKHFLDNIPINFRKHVYKHIESIMPPIPWAVGIKKEVEKRLIPLDEYKGKKLKVRRLIRWKLKMIANDTDYIRLVAAGGKRYGFDGYTETISDLHIKNAKRILTIKAEKKKKVDSKAKKNHTLKKKRSFDGKVRKRT
jgi:hypothetical protein